MVDLHVLTMMHKGSTVSGGGKVGGMEEKGRRSKEELDL